MNLQIAMLALSISEGITLARGASVDPKIFLDKKELKTINEAARSFGISLPMTTSAEQVYQQALDKGFGDLDYTGILAYLKSSTNSDNIQN